MPRKNPPKLSEEYPIVKVIKLKLKNCDEINTPQIEGYDRRVRNSPFLMVHLEYIQSLHNQKAKFLKRWQDEQKERRRIECCIDIQADRARKAEAEVERLTALLSTLSSPCSSAQPCYVPSLKVLASRALLVSPKNQMLPSV